MKNKATTTPTMKKFRAQITVEFDAPSREVAIARAKELYASEHTKVRVQESTISWLTLPDAAPTS
jgi:hypothetical protein